MKTLLASTLLAIAAAGAMAKQPTLLDELSNALHSHSATVLAIGPVQLPAGQVN